MKIVNEITDDHLAYWGAHHPTRVTMRAPEGMTDCADCVSVGTFDDQGTVVVRTAWRPDEIDLAHLARGGVIWLSTWGGLPPHMLEVQPPASTENTHA